MTKQQVWCLILLLVGGASALWCSTDTPDNAHFFPWFWWFLPSILVIVAGAVWALVIDAKDG